MKKIITIAVLLFALSTSYAQTNNTAQGNEKKQAETAKEVKKETAPAVNNATAKYDDDLSQYVGTNDFFLQLVREGVKKG